MYYTTSGSYKKTKMIIDYTNIVLTVAATVIFIIVLFLRSRSGILFPIEFLLGTIVNALTSVKHFSNGNKVSGLIAVSYTHLDVYKRQGFRDKDVTCT